MSPRAKIGKRALLAGSLVSLPFALGVAVWSCGSEGRQGAEIDGGAGAGDAPTETGTGDAGIEACHPQLDASEPEAIGPIDLTVPVPLGSAAFATAVAQCNYWSQCSPMAAYELDDCIASLSQGNGWTYKEGEPIREPGATGYQGESEGISFPVPGVAHPGPLLGAVEAGLVAYDPKEEAACLMAVQAQSCHGPGAWFSSPHCDHVFTCVGDGGDSDAAPGDGGSRCPYFLPTPNGPVSATCQADSDCADAGPAPAGPFCVAGRCVTSPCGELSDETSDGSCPTFVEAGQPCDSDAPRLGNFTFATPLGLRCAPGLACRGVSADGGLGTCGVPQDVGGPCVEGTLFSGCALGLVCECGACRIPPAQGPCLAGACEYTVAYCDFQSVTCKPVGSVGSNCPTGFECASNLKCDTTTNTCQRP